MKYAWNLVILPIGFCLVNCDIHLMLSVPVVTTIVVL